MVFTRFSPKIRFPMLLTKNAVCWEKFILTVMLILSTACLATSLNSSLAALIDRAHYQPYYSQMRIPAVNGSVNAKRISPIEENWEQYLHFIVAGDKTWALHFTPKPSSNHINGVTQLHQRSIKNSVCRKSHSNCLSVQQAPVFDANFASWNNSKLQQTRVTH